ncbi:MAG: sulfotransferase family protein [Deltaproteobacteria bacterium]|nr:sulfotransferase family protein [Deltaproteobacteria bacterium]
MHEDIRIDDLADPCLPEGFREQVEALRPMADALVFEPDVVTDQAIQATGLDDFGPDGWQIGLEVALRGMREDHELSVTGKLSAYSACVDFLKNRLLVEDRIKRNPEILDVELLPPVVIPGLPRSGTTHLHNLLGAAPDFRALPWWEALEPVLADSEKPAAGEEDPRRARAAAGIEARNAVLPHFDAMHEMTVDHVHEEIHLLGMNFGTMFFESIGIGALPTYREHYDSIDHTPHYQYLRRILKLLTWLRGGDRWVLKSPQHLDQLGPLMEVFPGAFFVFTHRDPVSTVASFATMISYSSRMSAANPEPVYLGHYWASRIEDMLRNAVRDRELVPADRSLDVLFHEYMGAELETIERIYEKAGLEFGETSRAAIRRYQVEHPRSRFGRVLYDLADFGLEADELRERFRFYTDRFPVRLEH